MDPIKSACEKTAYSDKQSALIAIAGFRKDKRPTRSKSKPVQAYQCVDCHQWHVTSNSNHRAQNKKKKPVEFHTVKDKAHQFIERNRKQGFLVIRNYSSKPL